MSFSEKTRKSDHEHVKAVLSSQLFWDLNETQTSWDVLGKLLVYFNPTSTSHIYNEGVSLETSGWSFDNIADSLKLSSFMWFACNESVIMMIISQDIY